jgi:ketosteroid isomerase-like protein
LEGIVNRSEELGQAIRRKNAAYGAGDIAGYLAAYAQDAIIFDRVPMTFDDLRRLMASQFADGRTLEYQIADDEPIRFIESSDAAIVCYPWREKFRYGDGRITDTEYYETNVWHRRNGQWQMVHAHLSVVKEHPVAG